METVLIGRTETVTITRDGPVVIIGERINPTGKKHLAEALRAQDMEYVGREAIAQVEQGALVVDVNVGAAGVDEAEVLPLAVKAVAEAVEVPISIDSAHEKALAAALAVCPGKPLVNSVNGEEASLARVLPLVKEHGAAVIGLTMDDDGIPSNAARRLEIADKIVNRATQQGIPPEDVVIDCLALTVGADHHAARVTLEAVRLVREKLGVNIALGASNVSFGLPERESINEIFVAMAIVTGLTCALVDPAKARRGILIAELLMGRDEYAMNYLGWYRAQRKKK